VSKQPAATRQKPCPCGGNSDYTACCGRWHAGALHLQAPSAQALMRSRYSAYALGLGTYLQDTWHASTRPADAPRFDTRLHWLGLEVKRQLSLGANEAEVEFVARSKSAGRAHRLHERSRFVFEAGRWFYVDGELL
jgi:SEC-C motif domain protein